MKTIKFWNWDLNDRAEVKIIPFILKIIACILVIMLIYSTIQMTIESAWDDARYNSKEHHLEYCDKYFYDRNFSDLYGELELYDLQSQEFDCYWEVVNGYWDYLEYSMYVNASKQVTTKDYSEKIMFQRDKIENNAKHCKFQSNQKLLNGFVDKLEQ